MREAEKRVFAIIPAHNEEEGIEETIMSILRQSHRVEKILIACDNCTDFTEIICHTLSKKYSNVCYFSTVNNKARKASALNQAFERIKEEEWDYLLQMDADSVIEENVVDEAIKEFFSNSELGGLSARYITKEYNGGGKILYVLQYLESCFVHSIQVERGMRTNVLSGAASFFRRKALLSFGNEVWDELSIVEDYALTLDLKKAGWAVRVGKNMYVKTDYMHTWKGLWKQRERWLYGGFEELTSHGWQNYTKREILSQINCAIFALINIVFVLGLFFLIVYGGFHDWTWHPFALAVPIVMIINKGYRSRYIQRKNFFNLFVANSLIPEYAFVLFLNVCMFVSYFKFLAKVQPGWK